MNKQNSGVGSYYKLSCKTILKLVNSIVHQEVTYQHMSLTVIGCVDNNVVTVLTINLSKEKSMTVYANAESDCCKTYKQNLD